MTILASKTKLSIAVIGATLAILGMGKTVQAATVNFDNLSTPSGVPDFIPADYEGYTWNNLAFLNSQDPNYTNPGFRNGTISDNNVAVNVAGLPASIESYKKGEDFFFNGAYLTAGWYDDLLLTVEGFQDGKSLFTDNLTLNTKAPIWYEPSAAGAIDKISFATSGDYLDVSGQLAMDNVNIAAVPEPSSGLTTMLMLGSFGGVAVWKHRKQQKARATSLIKG